MGEGVVLEVLFGFLISFFFRFFVCVDRSICSSLGLSLLCFS